jgi:hypothetical protein
MEIYQEKFWYNDVFLYGAIMKVALKILLIMTVAMSLKSCLWQGETISIELFLVACVFCLSRFMLFSFAIFGIRDNPETIREVFLKFRQLTTRFL